ncbi:MAG: UDP-N-acetylmuramate--L-alanine ligase [Chloroflexota bacterium]
MLVIDIGHRVHFVGVAGIGMSALARLLIARGHEVSGSDRSPGIQGERLVAEGATVFSDHAADNVRDADVVVRSSAVPSDNPELQAALSRGIPVIRRAELLAEIAHAGRSIAIAGTHGKTTTSALLSTILLRAGLDPTVLIGGISAELGSNCRVGSELTVVEADEYDGSFLPLHPAMAAITNVDPDHLDYYGSPQRVRAAFAQFATQVSEVLVVCADDLELPELAVLSPAKLVTYGLDRGEYRATDLVEDGTSTRFTLHGPQGSETFLTPLAGAHHVLNTVAAILLARTLDVPNVTIRAAVREYQGVARRLEVKGQLDGILVIDDYAHHPTEVRADLGAIKQRYGRPVRVCFQPHTYSRTADFFDEFTDAFSAADWVYLMDIYAARETDTRGVSGLALATAVALKHPNARYTETMNESLRALREDSQPGDIIVTMGAGDVYQIADRLLA